MSVQSPLPPTDHSRRETVLWELDDTCSVLCIPQSRQSGYVMNDTTREQFASVSSQPARFDPLYSPELAHTFQMDVSTSTSKSLDKLLQSHAAVQAQREKFYGYADTESREYWTLRTDSATSDVRQVD